MKAQMEEKIPHSFLAFILFWFGFIFDLGDQMHDEIITEKVLKDKIFSLVLVKLSLCENVQQVMGYMGELLKKEVEAEERNLEGPSKMIFESIGLYEVEKWKDIQTKKL